MSGKSNCEISLTSRMIQTVSDDIILTTVISYTIKAQKREKRRDTNRRERVNKS